MLSGTVPSCDSSIVVSFICYGLDFVPLFGAAGLMTSGRRLSCFCCVVYVNIFSFGHTRMCMIACKIQQASLDVNLFAIGS
jgi:hypothetical protein